MLFSIITKTLNWDILTDVIGLRMKDFNIFEVPWKIQFLGMGGRVTKNQNIWDSLKRGAWTVCRFKGRLG